jgi:hypothetical protein
MGRNLAVIGLLVSDNVTRARARSAARLIAT